MKRSALHTIAILVGPEDIDHLGHVNNVAYVQWMQDAAIRHPQSVTEYKPAENTTWYKVCVPDNVSTDDLIRRFITFVDANPKYTLASTAIQMMLAERYSCKR